MINLKFILFTFFSIIYFDIFYLFTIGKYIQVPMYNLINKTQYRYKFIIPIYIFLTIIIVTMIHHNFNILEFLIFGICIYGIFDFTLLVLYKEMDFFNALLDVFWGGTLFTILYIILNKFYKNY
jgi:hypothetical protein